MENQENRFDRRNFIKSIGVAGLTSAFAYAAEKEKPLIKVDPNKPKGEKKVNTLPTRKLGKTQAEVTVLSLGMMFDAFEKQIVLHRALNLGVTYWDTAAGYGNSEIGVGKFLSSNPDARKKLFIATKASGAHDPEQVEKKLQGSLEKMKTDYIDLYYGIHGMGSPDQLTDGLKQWAQDAKKRGVIKHFGFTTHSDMASHLMAASKLDWIDVIMMTYNFRLLNDKQMQDAVEACHKAGIGLVAMKVVGNSQKPLPEEEQKLLEHFTEKGLTPGQAKIKAVLEDKRITAACVGRDNIQHLVLNVDAVKNTDKLVHDDMNILTQHAQNTCSGYCAGCGNICGSATGTPYVSEVMRYLMYYNSYGEQQAAKELFAQLPDNTRRNLLNVDYGLAEARCPQHMPIRQLMAEAASKLA